MKSCIFTLSVVSLCAFMLLAAGACHPKGGHGQVSGVGDSATIFLKGQVDQLAAATGPLTLYSTHNGKEDSTRVQVGDIRTMTAPFLTALSALSVSSYKESTFPDSSNHRTVISYQALGDSTPLDMVDVYIDPDTKAIRKMYLQYIVYQADSGIRRQLIWEADKRFTLITTVDKNEYTADLLQQKVIWSKP